MADASPPVDKTLAAKFLAEAVGTFTLVYVGVLVLSNPGAGLLSVAFAHGLAIAVMASALMLVSGAHFNPAVTLAVLVGRRIDLRTAAVYWAAQLIGAFLGATLARLSLGGGEIGFGIPEPGLGVSDGTAILVEGILTFFLAFVVFGTGVDPRFGGRVGGLAIGLTVTMDILAGGPLTGAAMNPARWFGPALAEGELAHALIYTVGPALGGVLAGAAWSGLLLPKEGRAPA